MAMRILVLAVFGLWAGAFAGCGGGKTGPATAPVSGKITVNGSPLADAEVDFLHGDFLSQGKTDASGNYQLPRGAVPGENRVVIRKFPPEFQPNPDEGMDWGQLEGTDEGKRLMEKSEVPARYWDSVQSPLTITVPEGGTNSANFDL